MVHAFFHPHGPGTLAASLGLINRIGTTALEKAGELPGGSAGRAPLGSRWSGLGHGMGSTQATLVELMPGQSGA